MEKPGDTDLAAREESILFSFWNKRDTSNSPCPQVHHIHWNDSEQNNTNDGKQAQAKYRRRLGGDRPGGAGYFGGCGEELSIVLDVDRRGVSAWYCSPLATGMRRAETLSLNHKQISRT